MSETTSIDPFEAFEKDSNDPAIIDFEFQQSAAINELSDALSQAQGAMTGAIKDSANPFFKSRYADLSSVWDAIRKPFSDQGLSVIQMPSKGVGSVVVITQLNHKSGQWIRSRLTLEPTKADPQGVGTCITYARRYALAAMAGVAQVDDDANSQMAPEPIDRDRVQSVAKEAFALIDEDTEDYSTQAATNLLNQLSNDERMALQAILKASKPAGTKKTYYSCFRDHLRLEKEWLQEQPP